MALGTDKVGFTIAPPQTRIVAGFAVYGEFSRTNAIKKFDVLNLRENLGQLFDKYTPLETYETSEDRQNAFESFIDKVIHQVEEVKENLTRTIGGESCSGCSK